MPKHIVNYAVITVKCKHCPNPIDKGALRLGRGSGSQFVYFHPVCLFAFISQSKRAVQGIVDIQEVEGVDAIQDDDRNALITLINQAATRNNKPLDQGSVVNHGTNASTNPGTYPTPQITLTSTSTNPGTYPAPQITLPSTSTNPGTYPAPLMTLPSTSTNPGHFSAPQITLPCNSTNQGTYSAPQITLPSTSTNPGTYSASQIPSTRKSDPATSQVSVNAPQVQNNRPVQIVEGSFSTQHIQGPGVLQLGKETRAPTRTVDSSGARDGMGNSLATLGQLIYISSDDSEDEGTASGHPAKKARIEEEKEGLQMGEGGEDSRGKDGGEDECSVCLDPPVHPVALPCGHTYCYLCAKGLVLADVHSNPLCSLCRRAFPRDYLESARVLHEASVNLNDTPPLEADSVWQWFYQGNKGWWRFEERNNAELEDNFTQGAQFFETMICGNLYTIDFVNMEQFQSNYPMRKRKIKRDLKTTVCKGVAGLQKRSWNRSSVS